MTETTRSEPEAGPFAKMHAALVWEVLAVAALTLLALLLRVHDVTQAPRFLDNLDELQFAWAGLGLIEHGDAYTWSYFSVYPQVTQLHIDGVSVPMVHHWMDHPPLYSLLSGGWVWLLGDRQLGQVTAAQVRVIPVVCSTLTVPLLQLLGRSIAGQAPALLAAALLATSPAAVLLGRESEPEAAQAVLLLLALLACWRLLHGGGVRRWLAVLVLCSVLAPAMKVSGVAVGVIAGVVLLAERRLWLAVWAGGATAGGLLIYVLYGALVDWPLFLQVVLSQSQNRLDVLTAIAFITEPTGVNRTLHDGWWLLGWIGLALCALLGRRNQRLLLVWPAAAYAATMLLLAGTKQTAAYGWYKLIVYPEVYLAAGVLAWTALRRLSLGLLVLLLVLGGTTATNWIFAGPTGGWAPSPLLLVLVLVVVLGPVALLRWGPRWRAAARWVTGGAMGVMLAGNAAESWVLSFIFTRM